MKTMTLQATREHYGFADDVSEAAVRAAATADEIEIETTADPEGAAGLTAKLASVVEEVRKLREIVKTRGEEMAKTEADRAAALSAQADQLLERIRDEGIGTKSKETREPNVKLRDRFDAMGYTRGDFELAGMIFGGTKAHGGIPTVEPPGDFKAAWQYHLFESDGERIAIANGDGDFERAMDAQESGFGSQLIGVQFVADLWEAARNNDEIVSSVRDIPMTAPVTRVPIDGDLPEMLFVGENTGATDSAYSTSKTASNRVTLTAKKFTIQQIWSGELEVDSIIAFTPFLRERLNISAGLHMGSAMLNGDETTTGTGNINKDDGAPGSTKHYLAWDGIRHYWIVTATGQGKNMAAELDPTEIIRARGKLNGSDDDVDALLKNVNWGKNPRELRLVMDWDTFMNMHELDVVKTVDQYGPAATVLTGELGSYQGIPIISPSYASKTDTDGKAVDTESSNTKGQITLFNPRGFLSGTRRATQLFFDRIQGRDQFLFELYTRRAFTRFGGNVAAGIYNVTVA